MTPAENKQTVEALAEKIEYEAGVLYGNGDFRFRVGSDRAFKELRAAFRDLVAQADRAAELEAALREIDRDCHWIIIEPDPDAGQHLDGCVGCFARAALAGDGGGA